LTTTRAVSCLHDPSLDSSCLEETARETTKQKRSPRTSSNALKVLMARYLLRDVNGRVIEIPRDMFERVAREIAAVDLIYDAQADTTQTRDRFYRLMAHREFLPNSPTLMNAGLKNGQLSACFVIPVSDAPDQILSACNAILSIQNSGGGTGFSLSTLEPRRSPSGPDVGRGSGPVLMMRLIDSLTEMVKQKGKRRGANIGVLDVTHPDILEFITSKDQGRSLQNFTISVAVSDRFMQAVERDEDYELVDPTSKTVRRRVHAPDVFDLLAKMAWKNGDPGILFIDEINRHNVTPEVGSIQATNPCGEQPLLPYESCILGSINLAVMVKDRRVDWEKLRLVIHSAVHFLDNCIDANVYPSPEIEQVTKSNRKIGLGIMGWADMLVQIGVPYGSEKAVKLADEIGTFLQDETIEASMRLASERGSFPNFRGSSWDARGYARIRNATLTTIAPTGTTSMIAGCSPGIEPLFAISFVRKALNGELLRETNPLFVKVAKERSFYSRGLMNRIAEEGSVQNIGEVPEDIRRVFVTARDIPPESHVKIISTFQKYCDSSVSKTVNMPYDSRVSDVKRVFMLAYRLRCKGITVYRWGSKEDQIIATVPQHTGCSTCDGG